LCVLDVFPGRTAYGKQRGGQDRKQKCSASDIWHNDVPLFASWIFPRHKVLVTNLTIDERAGHMFCQLDEGPIGNRAIK